VSARVKLQTLTCAEGHEWMRQVHRGAVPRYCPGHEPVAITYARAWRELQVDAELASLRDHIREVAQVCSVALAGPGRGK